MSNTISKKYIVDYLVTNYGETRHYADRMVKAIMLTAKRYGLDKKYLFHYIIERTDGISGAKSYGFDTAYGREIREKFMDEYYKN